MEWNHLFTKTNDELHLRKGEIQQANCKGESTSAMLAELRNIDQILKIRRNPAAMVAYL